MNEDQNEKKVILSHEPAPGYRPVFYIVSIVAVLYLGGIFLSSIL